MSYVITAIVIKGTGEAKKNNAPTININPRRAPKSLTPGVYSAKVVMKVGQFPGALYYGPRFKPPHRLVLEVHCLGLKKNLYHTHVTIKIIKRIRGVKNFKSALEAKKTIRSDIKRVRALVSLRTTV